MMAVVGAMVMDTEESTGDAGAEETTVDADTEEAMMDKDTEGAMLDVDAEEESGKESVVAKTESHARESLHAGHDFYTGVRHAFH